jgi:hypothetical protein
VNKKVKSTNEKVKEQKEKRKREIKKATRTGRRRMHRKKIEKIVYFWEGTSTGE